LSAVSRTATRGPVRRNVRSTVSGSVGRGKESVLRRILDVTTR
jgi:hypothetical protein